MSRSLRQLQLPGVLRVGIIVEAAAGLAAVPAGKDHALQKGRRGEALFLEFVEHHVSNVISSVKTNKVEQRERTHGVAAAELHGVVNVLGGGGAVLKNADGVEQIGYQEAVDDEPGAVGGAHGNFADARPKGHHLFEHGGIGGESADDFQKLHILGGVEKIQALGAVGGLGGSCEFLVEDCRRG